MKTRMGKKKFAEKNAVALCLKKFISTAKAMQGLSPLKIIFSKKQPPPLFSGEVFLRAVKEEEVKYSASS